MNLEKIGKIALKKSQAKGLQVEIFLDHSRGTAISIIDQKIETIHNFENQGLAVRFIGSDRMGFAYTSDLSEPALTVCIEKAFENHKHNAQDPYWDIAKKQKVVGKQMLQTQDPAYENISLQEKIELAMEIEKQARSVQSVCKTETVAYSDAIKTKYIFNSNGVELSHTSTHFGGSANVIAEDKNGMESGSEMNYVTQLKDLEHKNIGLKAGQQAQEMLGAQTPRTKKTNIVLSQEVSISFLAVIAEMFLADAVQKKTSLLAEKKGQLIGTQALSIVDDGLMPGQIGTKPFDDEGTPCRKIVLLQNGVLKNFLYNIYTAKKDGTQSTGQGSRGGYTEMPSTSPNNLFIEPGKLNKTAILQKAHNGIYITKVMGMHTANPISGDFSIGIAGIEIKNGQLFQPLRGGAIAGNLLSLLSAIAEIGSDLRFLPLGGNIGSPTLLISDISVSGQ